MHFLLLFSKQAEKKIDPPVGKTWEEFEARVPLDDVWLLSRFPPRRLDFLEAVEQHRELVASPDMLNNPDALLVMKAELDMRTKKKVIIISCIKSNPFHLLLDHSLLQHLDSILIQKDMFLNIDMK